MGPYVTIVMSYMYMLLFIPDVLVWPIYCRSRAGHTEVPFLLKDGSLEVPLDCSVRCLGEFLLHNYREITQTRRKHER